MVARQKLEGTQDKVDQVRDSALSGWETEIMTNTSSDQKVVDLFHNEKHTVKNRRNDLLQDKWPNADHDRKERNYNEIGVPRDPICAPNLDDRSYDKDNLNGSDKASKRRRKKHPGTLDLNKSSSSNNPQLVDSVCTLGKHASKSTETSCIRVPPLRDVESCHSRSKAKEKTITTIGTTSSPWSMGFSSFSTRLSSKYQDTTNPADKNHDPSDRCGGAMMISSSSNNNLTSTSHAKQYPQKVSSGSSSSAFTFDIPFLKSQLNQMKVTGQEKDRVQVLQRGLFQQPKSLSAEAAQRHGNLCDPKGGYIKVPVHFADQPSSLSAAAAAAAASRSLSVVNRTMATTFPAGIAADDTKLTLKL